MATRNFNVKNGLTAGNIVLDASTGNANVDNLGTTRVLATANVTAPQLISNIATGTAPFVVTSTTQVANLSVATAGTVTTAAQPNITSVGTLTSLGVNGTVTAVAFTANTGIFTGNGSALTALNASNISTGTVPTARLASGTANANTYLAGDSTWKTITIPTVSSISNGNSNVNIPSANGNVNISSAGNANVLVITGTGVNVEGTLNSINLVTSGNANLTTLSVAANAIFANSTRLTLGTGVGLVANGNLGLSGQVLTSNSTSTFWGNKGAAISNSAPTIANQGDMWWDTDIGTLFVYYDDGISTQWVEAVPQLLIETTPNVYQLNGSLVVTNDLTVQGMLYETSDATLKKNIETFSNPLDTISQLRGVEFDWKKTDKHSAGVIAQELETILPYLVATDTNGVKSVNYTAIIGVLIEAIKELGDKVDRLCQ